jgi:hypothetical protein
LAVARAGRPTASARRRGRSNPLVRSRCAGIKPAIKRRYLARLATAALSLPEQDGGGGDVLCFEDAAEPLDAVAVGHRLRDWHCAR